MVSGGLAHTLPFDPACGYDLPALLKVAAPEPPRDFEAFWRATYEAAADTPLELQATPVTFPGIESDVFEVSFNSWGGARIAGWLTLPKDRRIERGIVFGHGYGGRAGPDDWLPSPRTAAIFPCARGLGWSADPRIPAFSHEHVLHGISSRETYVHRGCVADVWAAVSALGKMAPAVGEDLTYVGASFGGGIGALAMPWERRIKRAFLEVPSFGHHPLRLGFPSVGSGEAVRRHVLQHPEATTVLAYYDAAIAAGFIRVPTLVAAARFDPAVPPPGQFAVYNAIPAEKRLVVMTAGHFNHAGAAEDVAAIRAALVQFMAPGSWAHS